MITKWIVRPLMLALSISATPAADAQECRHRCAHDATAGEPGQDRPGPCRRPLPEYEHEHRHFRACEGGQ